MEKVVRSMKLLGRLKWLGLIFAAVMCFVVQPKFGDMWGLILGLAAGLSFISICEKGKRGILKEHIAEDIKAALMEAGFGKCIIEIKLFKLGMLIRIFTLNYGENVLKCNKALVEKITRSWYREKVWVTQIADVKTVDLIKAAREELDEQLLKDIRKMRDNLK